MAHSTPIEQLDLSSASASAATLVEYTERLKTLSIGIESPLLKALADRPQAAQLQRLREALSRVENEAGKALAYLDVHMKRQ